MKRFLALLPVLMMAFAGCVNVEQKITLDKNGGGEYDVVYSMPEKTVNQLTALFALKDQLIEAYEGNLPAPVPDDRLARIFANPSEDQIREEVGKYAKLGLKIEDVKVDTSKAARTVRLRLSFTDIGELAKAEFFRRYGFSLAKTTEPVNRYVLQRSPRVDTSLEPPDFTDPEVLKTLTPVYTGFRVVTEIRVPGRVLKSNAHAGSRYAATWIYDFDADKRAVTAFQSDDMRVEFDGADLDLPVFDLEPEPVPGS